MLDEGILSLESGDLTVAGFDAVQVSDTTKFDSSAIAGYKIFLQIYLIELGFIFINSLFYAGRGLNFKNYG